MRRQERQGQNWPGNDLSLKLIPPEFRSYSQMQMSKGKKCKLEETQALTGTVIHPKHQIKLLQFNCTKPGGTNPATKNPQNKHGPKFQPFARVVVVRHKFWALLGCDTFLQSSWKLLMTVRHHVFSSETMSQGFGIIVVINEPDSLQNNELNRLQFKGTR